MAKSKRRNKNRRFTLTFALLLSIVVGYFLYQRQWSHPKEDFVGLRDLPENFNSYGIDISHYQNEIDWDVFFEQADSTIGFVYCKATEGISHVDKQYEQNRNALRENKKKFGVYHFFVPTLNPQLQADHFLNNYNYKNGELPPVLDVETESVSDEKLIERMKVWLSIVEKHTRIRPVIYTSYHFYNTKFAHEFPQYEFWIANYSDHEERLKDDRIIHWQYTDQGGVPGIDGPVDLNMSKQKFY